MDIVHRNTVLLYILTKMLRYLSIVYVFSFMNVEADQAVRTEQYVKVHTWKGIRYFSHDTAKALTLKWQK
jgi:hypothetical protein